MKENDRSKTQEAFVNIQVSQRTFFALCQKDRTPVFCGQASLCCLNKEQKKNTKELS